MANNLKGYEYLHTLPNTITFYLDQNNSIIKIFGKNSQDIQDIYFSKNDIKNITKIKNSTIDNFKLNYKNKEYDVHYDNNLLYLYDISRCNTIQSKLEQSLNDLKSKKEELQAVFDLTANGISILDRDGMFLYANKFFQNMMEYSMEELYKESCISLSSPEYQKSSETAVEKAIKYGSIENFRKVCVTKSGKHLNAAMSLSYIKSTDEIVMITSNITQDIRYQEKLKQQVEIEVKKRAEQYEVMFHQSRLAAMGEMINAIAHQWRQPLNGLGIIVQSLRHISKQKQINIEFLKEIESEIMEKINFMSQTIDDFSSFFKVSKQKISFNLYTSINDAIRLIEVQLKTNNIHIDFNTKYKDIKIYSFANEFRQVVLNILTNSMNAIDCNGHIDINIKSKKDTILISIKDTGGGIKEGDINKIFDPYFTTKDKGSGIGLYMSKIIIEHHMEGKLNVSNTQNGAKFIIELKEKDGNNT